MSVALSACGEPSPSPRARAAAAHPFCAEAMGAVDAFLAASPDLPSGEGYGGTAVVGGIAELVNGMNTLATVDYGANLHHQFVNLMTLVQVDEGLNPVPYLAESWSFSEDGTELTFRLRNDVYWHDGEITDAHDVAFTFLRATDPETAFPNAAFWDRYVGGTEGVEVVDDFTVRFRMEPHAEPLDPWRTVAIMPEHLLGEVPPSELATHPFASTCPVGNGPFVFASHSPQESWVFQANPRFPEGLGGPPSLARYVYRIVPDQTTLLTELLSGTVDVFMGVRPDQAAIIEESDAAELRAFDPREFTFVGWNTRRPQLADPGVRRALTVALDREAAVDAILRGYGIVAQSGIPPFHWAHEPALDVPSHDPAEAARLLDRAGWRDRDGDGIRENAAGLPLQLTLIFNAGNQVRRSIAELMQAQLGDVGVEVSLEALEPGELARRVTDPSSRDFDGLILSWVNEFRVSEKDLFHSDRADTPLGFAGLRDARLDTLIDRIQRVTDRDEARPLWRAYQERIVELQPFTYFFYAQKLTGVSRRMENVQMDPRGELLNVARWRVSDPDGE